MAMKMRKLNPTPGQVLLGVGAVTLGLLAAGVAFAAEPKKKNKKSRTEPVGPDPDEEEKRKAAELLQFLVPIGNEAQGNALYQLQQGDLLVNVARSVFRNAGIPDAANAGQARVAYMRCVHSSEFNRSLYGKRGDFTNNFPGPGTDKVPSSWVSPDDISLRSAFLIKSGNYVGDLVNGKLPSRRSGPKLGLLWLPDVDPSAWTEFGEIACLNMEPPPLTED